MKAASFIWRNLNIFQCFDQLRKLPNLQTFRVFCKFPTFQKLSQNTVLQRSGVPLGLPGGFAVPKAEPRGGVRSDLDGEATSFFDR